MMTPDIHLNGYHPYEPAAWVVAAGEDASEFLQSQFSNDLSRLEVGQVSYGLWLDQKGKVHADSFVFRQREQTFLLMSYAAPEAVILEKLNSFIVADDVELEGRARNMAGITLVGESVSFVRGLGISGGEAGEIVLEGEPVIVFPGRRGDTVAVELFACEAGRELLIRKLKAWAPDGLLLDAEAMKALRILGKCPSIPQDIGPKELPQEGGLEADAVSFSKGCYLGQEVMSRLHSMGQVRRSLRLVQSKSPVEYESAISLDGKKVGLVKTSALIENSYYSLVLLSNAVGDHSGLAAGEPDNPVSLTVVS